MLIAALVLVAMIFIALAVAAPKIAVELQRDKEDELMHRGLQYARAIRLYYKKFGRYPASIDQLEKTNEIRFLRKRYRDPVTGKDEWHLIHYGEAKVKPTGLFGQPLAASGLGTAAAAMTNGIGSNGAIGGAGMNNSSAFGGQSGSSSSAFGSSGIGGNSASGSSGNSGSAFNSGTPTPTPTAPTTDPGTGATATTGATGVTGVTGATGTTGTTGTTTGGSTTGEGSPSAFGTPAGGTSNGQNQTFGGGGIVGVSSTSLKKSIREFKKQKHYNEWEFVYDPQLDMLNQNGTGVLQGQGGNTNLNGPNGSPTAPAGFGTQGSGFGTPGSSFGSQGGIGTTPTPTPTPTPTAPPQQ